MKSWSRARVRAWTIRDVPHRTSCDRADPWRPRDEPWLARAPSRFAGRPARPLFVGGCRRSGTTLLRSMLHNHPDLAVPAETAFVIPLFTSRVRLGDLRDPARRRAVAEWIFDPDVRGRGGRRIRAGIPREEAIARVVAAPPTLGSLFEACFRMFAEARRWARDELRRRHLLSRRPVAAVGHE